MSIFNELKRRNVIRVAVAYVVASWVLIEGGSLILGIYDAPGSVIRTLVALLALGLPFALVFAWAFEVTPEGIKREADVDRSQSSSPVTAKRLDLLTIAMVVAGIGLLIADRYVPGNDGDVYLSVPKQDAAQSPDADSHKDVLWATQQLLQVDRMRDLGEYSAAFDLATEIAPLLPRETIDEEFWASFSWSADIETDPTGARVYRQPIDAAENEWQDLGTTPLRSVRFAEGDGYRLRIELEGHRSVELLETAIDGAPWRGEMPLNPVILDPLDVLPAEMIRIPGFTRDLVDYASFFIDRFEISNREYQRFVTAGGYEKREYWSHAFIRDGAQVSWEDAMKEFVDRTERPGPSTWSGGAYSSGHGDYPVGGISWYEAAAFASFVGKELPTWIHHRMAGRFYRENSWIVAPRSNLGGEGPRPVGENRAMNTMGIYDLAGNVREWCWNEAGKEKRGTTGGAWTDPPFHVRSIIPKSPWDRDSTNGFRLIRTFDDDEKLARLREPRKPSPRRDYAKEVPVSDADFAIYRRMYAYDLHPLNAETESVDSFEQWTRERVAFDLPYGERGAAVLYIPNNADPPFQTVIYWPGSGALDNQSLDEEYLEAFTFLMRSGKAVVQPILMGTFDRGDENFDIMFDSLWSTSETSRGTWYRDLHIQWVQEVSRTIDYLESRNDIDSDKLGFYGFSWGGSAAPIVLAVDHRIDAAVVNVGGLDDFYHYLPEIDPINFVTRVRTPILMLNGEYDIVFPLETSQKPMFELLGTDPKHKLHYVTPAAHMVPQDVLIRETLNWFDRYLGSHGD